LKTERASISAGLTLGSRLAGACTLLCTVAACVPSVVSPPSTTPSEQEQYARIYPYYAEICALSQLGKKHGFGAEISSGFGGHAVLYLNGVCRKKDAGYPILQMCDEQVGSPTADGVGLSVNAHYMNADWVAIEGRTFFFDGDLRAGEPLSRDTYRAVLAKAQSRGIYDGVSFHNEVYDGMPAGFSRSSFQYEVSVATDFAIKFGRNRYCARVPLSRRQTAKIVDYLNAVNEPYRRGKEIFDWNVLTHNCSHINHNALAAANLWDEWPIDRFILVSMLDFPVPKNEFVNTMRRTNDMPIADLEAIYDDRAARTLLLQDGRLPTAPGAIADLDTIASPNEVYDTQSRIIFYDDPITGAYQRRFNAILTESRYFRLRDNLIYFAQLYRKIESERKPLEWHIDKRGGMSTREKNEFSIFYQKYYDYIHEQIQVVARSIRVVEANVH
jgi:hypothetical protein